MQPHLHFPKDTLFLITGSAGFIGANLVLRLLESQEPIKIVDLIVRKE